MEVGSDWKPEHALRRHPPVVEVEDRRRSASDSTLALVAVAATDNLPARRRTGRRPAWCTTRQSVGGPVPSAVSHRPHQRAWPAAVVDRLSGSRAPGRLRSRPDEDVDRDAALREFALVTALPDSGAACRRQVESAGHVPRTRGDVLRAVASDGPSSHPTHGHGHPLI
jgi:hypothetical protein